MSCPEIKEKLSEYIDGALPAEEEKRVAAHLGRCESCAVFLSGLREVVAEASALPASLEPDEDLWPDIAARVRPEPGRSRRTPLRWMAWGAAAAAAAVVLLLFLVNGTWLARRTASPAAWEVTAVAGTPICGGRDVKGSARLAAGEWLRTDNRSRARLQVADVGRVDVGPGSAVQLLRSNETEHRISLAGGEVHAFIWAPPRLFFVETPAGVAEDLGCEYDLVVDAGGNGELEVTLGFVSFEHDGREAIVPHGTRCELRKGFGPGTPHNAGASRELRDALSRYDFGGGERATLEDVLALAGKDDAVTLWHLVSRAEGSDREAVFDRLAAYAPPPSGVTREGILRLDESMLRLWWIDMHPGWSVW